MPALRSTHIAVLVLVAVALVAGGLVLFREPDKPDAPGSTAGAMAPSGAINPDDTTYLCYIIDPRATPVEMFWRDDRDQTIGSLAGLRALTQRQGRRLRFAMNGGMYHPDRNPVGLFIQNRRVLRPLDTTSGLGNFYLKPNGVFLIRRDHTAAVVASERFVYTSDLLYATQSGPMLLVDGVRHPVFEEPSQHLNIRNGVGVRPDGTVVFAISRVKVNLYAFAEYFRRMGCTNALYLDGFVSRCYCPEMGCEQLDGNFGVMIGITW